jgi:hypothetical protein
MGESGTVKQNRLTKLTEMMKGPHCGPFSVYSWSYSGKKKAHHRGWAKTTHSNSLLYSGESGCLKINSLISNIGNMLFIPLAGVFKNPLISLKPIIFCHLYFAV